MGWLRKLVDWIDPLETSSITTEQTEECGHSHFAEASARHDAKSRLKLVLMHDRTQLSPSTLTQMRDDMVEVISKYVEIDKDALEVNLENNESNAIALVANIPVLRARVMTTTH